MPVYEYEARSADGRVVKGKMDVVDENALVNALRKDNYFPTKVKPYIEGLSNIDINQIRKVPLKDISIFCRQFSVIITAGISILRGLEIVKQQTENKKLVRVLTEVFEDVQKGKALSAAMGKHSDFPEMLINMIEVGEASGTLDQIMERMAVYYDKEYKQQQKIRQAMTYPIVVCIVAIGVVTLLVTVVIPQFVSILNANGSDTLPLPTRIVLGVSDFVRSKWYILVAAIILIAILVGAFRKSESGRQRIDKFKLTAPILGKVYSKIVTSRFARTFGILLASGVPLLQSISICSSIVGNIIVEESLDTTREEIKKGSSIGDTLGKSGIFPMMLTQMINIGEESGTLDDILTKTSEFYDNEVETATAQLTSMIEPLIIIVLGSIVAFIILSILLPMFQMYDSISG